MYGIIAKALPWVLLVNTVWPVVTPAAPHVMMPTICRQSPATAPHFTQTRPVDFGRWPFFTELVPACRYSVIYVTPRIDRQPGDVIPA